MYFGQGMGYRNDHTTGVPKGEEPESMYMVVSGKHFDEHCCFDYGNAETNDKDDGPRLGTASSMTAWQHAVVTRVNCTHTAVSRQLHAFSRELTVLQCHVDVFVLTPKSPHSDAQLYTTISGVKCL